MEVAEAALRAVPALRHHGRRHDFRGRLHHQAQHQDHRHSGKTESFPYQATELGELQLWKASRTYEFYEFGFEN